MTQPPTLADVAAAAGVSLASASRALDPTTGQQCSKRMADRVQQAAREIGYVPLRPRRPSQLLAEIEQLRQAVDAGRTEIARHVETNQTLVARNVRLRAENGRLQQTVVALRAEVQKAGPRMWVRGEPPPSGVATVRDSSGRLWQPTAQAGWWIDGDGTAVHWTHLAAKRGPLTEVPPTKRRGKR